MRIAICDDERHFRENLHSKLKSYCEHRGIEAEISSYCSAKKLLDDEMGSCLDIIFLDVSMPFIDGISAGKVISKKSPKTIIVYVSGLIEHAPASHEIENTMRYILKDTLDIKLGECMEAIFHKLNYQNKRFYIEFTDGEMPVYRNEVVYIDSVGHLLTFHFSSWKREPLSTRRYTLKSICTLLGEDLFVRVDQSFIVNMSYIEEFLHNSNGHVCVLKNGKKILVSQRRYKEAKRKFFLFKGSL